MKASFNKIALYDLAENKFYAGSEDTLFRFSTLDKAKLYASRLELKQTLEYISNQTKRNIIPVEVNVEYEVDVSMASNVIVDQVSKHRKKLEDEFAKLDVQAQTDVEAMSQKDYKRWKTLKHKIRMLVDYGIVE